MKDNNNNSNANEDAPLLQPTLEHRPSEPIRSTNRTGEAVKQLFCGGMYVVGYVTLWEGSVVEGGPSLPIYFLCVPRMLLQTVDWMLNQSGVQLQRETSITPMCSTLTYLYILLPSLP